MYIGTLDPVSNRATWTNTVELIDQTTGQAYDISTADEITIQLRDQKNKSLALSGSMTGGEVTIEGTGTFRWTFPPDRMGALCDRTYDVGITVAFPDATTQVFIGTIPVLEGVVR